VHGFLVERLIPHTTAEDWVLYPAFEEAMGTPGATRTLRLDHVAIGRLVSDLAWLRAHLRDPTVTCDQAMALRRVLYGLHAIVKLHLAREEEIVIPVLDDWLTPGRAVVLFRAIAEAEAAAVAAA
jgi:iron-sulfur cluster repair protein YtfE (RIC family)